LNWIRFGLVLARCLRVSEPLEKEINEILVSKREDRFSNTFFELVQKMSGSLNVPASSG